MADSNLNSGTFKPGTYRIENNGFPSEPVKRVIDLKGSGKAPETPIICYPNANTQNQKWRVTKFEDGYNFQAVYPPSNIFVGSVGPDDPVTGTPYQKTAFLIVQVGGSNNYQIVATSNEGFKYALQAPYASSETIVLRSPDATEPRQIWHFVKQDAD